MKDSKLDLDSNYVIFEPRGKHAHLLTSLFRHLQLSYDGKWQMLADTLEEIEELLPYAINDENKQEVLHRKEQLKGLRLNIEAIKVERMFF